MPLELNHMQDRSVSQAVVAAVEVSRTRCGRRKLPRALVCWRLLPSELGKGYWGLWKIHTIAWGRCGLLGVPVLSQAEDDVSACRDAGGLAVAVP